MGPSVSLAVSELGYTARLVSGMLIRLCHADREGFRMRAIAEMCRANITIQSSEGK